MGTTYPIPCAPGYFQDELGSYQCKPCTEGMYCPITGLSVVAGTCAAGFVCFGAAIYEKPYDYQTGRICALGHFCIGGLEFPCPGGTYAPAEGLSECYVCPPGFYCNFSKGTITPLSCITGHYCVAGTQTPVACPLGTYTQGYQNGLEDKTQCSACPTGFFCQGGTFETSNKCNAGYYCHSGAYLPNQPGFECPSGYFCEQGTKLPTACPDGLYTPRGASMESNCSACLAGFYCVRYVYSS